MAEQTPIPSASDKNSNIIKSLKADFDVYRQELDVLPTGFVSQVQKPLFVFLQWLSFFAATALLFLLLFVLVSGNDMAAGIAAKYFNVPSEQLSDAGLSGVKKLVIWMLVLVGVFSALIGVCLLQMRKLADKHLKSRNLAAKVIKDIHSKIQYLEER